MADHAKDWLTLLLAGLGVTFAPHEWIGGMLLAFVAAAFDMRSDPEQDQRELWPGPRRLLCPIAAGTGDLTLASEGARQIEEGAKSLISKGCFIGSENQLNRVWHLK